METSALKYEKVVLPSATLQKIKPGMSLMISTEDIKTSILRDTTSQLKKEEYLFRVSDKGQINETIVECLKKTRTMKNRMRKKTSAPLSNYDQNVLLPIMMKGLEMKKGKANAVTGKQIMQGIRNAGLRIDERHVCRLINHIRTNDLVVGLMSSNKGYYITANEQELLDYENILLSREVALREVRKSMKRQRRSMFSQIEERQLQLF